MVAMTGLDIPQKVVRQQITSAIQLVMQLNRLSDGTRKLVSLMEITGLEGDEVAMREIFRFNRRGLDADGNVLGEIVPTGLIPTFFPKLRLAGCEVDCERVFGRLPTPEEEAEWIS
jgi:pilus assembly protein CpaF